MSSAWRSYPSAPMKTRAAVLIPPGPTSIRRADFTTHGFDDRGVPRIRFEFPGDSLQLLDLHGALSLAAALRSAGDDAMADAIEASVKKARRGEPLARCSDRPGGVLRVFCPATNCSCRKDDCTLLTESTPSASLSLIH